MNENNILLGIQNTWSVLTVSLHVFHRTQHSVGCWEDEQGAYWEGLQCLGCPWEFQMAACWRTGL